MEAKSGEAHSGEWKSPNTQELHRSIEWYAPGQSRTVDVDGIPVTIRLVGRRGRRARIAVTVAAVVAAER
jgi:hypothetical protein